MPHRQQQSDEYSFVPELKLVSQPLDKRRRPRKPARLAATITIDEITPSLPCVIWDISDEGAKIAAGRPGLLPEHFTLMFSGGASRRCQIRWRGGRFVGVLFVDD
jgi:hypothetical protein